LRGGLPDNRVLGDPSEEAVALVVSQDEHDDLKRFFGRDVAASADRI
jgi:hypothetical protein